MRNVILDPARVWLRHIVRATSTTPGAVQVLPGQWFAPFTTAYGVYDGLNGPGGWQSGEYQLTLQNEGTFRIVLPNTAGRDGLLHRRRFAILTDPAYELGEEWIEFYIGTNQLLFVGTPDSATKRTQSIEITGVDATALMDFARASDLDTWRAAPRDVFEAYTAAGVAHVAADWTANLTPTIPFDASVYQDSSDGKLKGVGVTADGTTPYVVMPNNASVINFATIPYTKQSAIEVQASGYIPNLTGAGQVTVTLNYGSAVIWATFTTTTIRLRCTTSVTSSFAGFDASLNRQAGQQSFDMRILIRGNWVFFFFDGQLVMILPFTTAPGTSVAQFHASLFTSYSDTVRLETFSITENVGFLLRGTDKGDYRLPGSPVSGGLRGRYFKEDQVRAMISAALGPILTADALNLMLAPDPRVEAWQSRLDPVINFTGSPPTWQPGGGPPGGNFFSVRWTGSIYLDLTGNGRKIQLTAVPNARVWIGQTMPGQEILDVSGAATESVNLQSTLGAIAGWFPIVIEYKQLAGGSTILLEDSPLDGAGNATGYTTVPATRLSEEGCYENLIRLDAHRAILESLNESFGIQWTCSPRQLESGEFPGQIIPRVREGRDTEMIVNPSTAVSPEVKISARESVDALIADAAGIATDGAQLVVHAVDADAAYAHLFPHVDYVSVAEISERPLVAQRLKRMLALRTSPFEDVQAQPVGMRQPIDTWPLTGAAAMFDWHPGDGIRIDIPDIDVRDLTPRQITSAQFPIRPAGRGTPSVAWRQRPRSLKRVLRGIIGETRAARRNYQGQFATIASAATASGVGNRSMLPLPYGNVVITVTLVVLERIAPTTTEWTLWLNGVTTAAGFNDPGRYDITGLWSLDGTNPQLYAELRGGTGTATFLLEAKIRI